LNFEELPGIFNIEYLRFNISFGPNPPSYFEGCYELNEIFNIQFKILDIQGKFGCLQGKPNFEAKIQLCNI